MNVIKNLNYDNIVEESLSSKLHGKILMDFISLNDHVIDGADEFSKWKDDFKNKNIPFIITKTLRPRNKYKDETWFTLWKQQIGFTKYQYKNRYKRERYNHNLIEKD